MNDRLELWPMSQRAAMAFIATHHRHNRQVRGDIYRVGIRSGDEIWGVAMVGRPKSRVTQANEPQTAELVRLCVRPGAPPNTLRTLHAAVLRAAWALGYTRVISFTLQSESGNSMRDAGYRCLGERRARSWHTKSRPRADTHEIAPRLLWETTR